MNILLDTHILIWALEDSDRVSGKARELIINPVNGIFGSRITQVAGRLYLGYPNPCKRIFCVEPRLIIKKLKRKR